METITDAGRIFDADRVMRLGVGINSAKIRSNLAGRMAETAIVLLRISLRGKTVLRTSRNGHIEQRDREQRSQKYLWFWHHQSPENWVLTHYTPLFVARRPDEPSMGLAPLMMHKILKPYATSPHSA